MSITICSPKISRGWCYPRAVQRFAERLLTQQVWCFGQDVKCESGNLLMQYGFERYRTEESPLVGSTCYRIQDADSHINLWGFGLFYGEQEFGGLYLGRYRFQPLWSNRGSLPHGIHSPLKLPAFSRPRYQDDWLRAHHLCQRMFHWIADYESWVISHSGVDYREKCIEKWSRSVCEAEQTAASWRFLADRSWEDEHSDWESQLQFLNQ